LKNNWVLFTRECYTKYKMKSQVTNMTMIKDFLLQLTLIALPMFIYHTFVNERLRHDKIQKLVLSALWGLSLILCMSFPANFGPDYHLDIRIVPLLMGTLYGGTGTGIFLAALVILYRLYMGTDIGFYNTVLAILSAMPIIFVFQKSFDRAKKDKRVKIAILLSLCYCLAGITWFCILRNISLENLSVKVIYLIFILLVIWFFITLNENMRENRQLRLNVQNAGKLQIISDLTSVFAHEIRNPMQVTRGFLQLLNEPDLTDKKKAYIQLSIEELDRANEIINDLLLFGKPSTNNNERVNVGYQLKRVLNILTSYSISQNVTIITDISDDCWTQAIPQKLNQCLINILKNGIESMPSGGVVWASCAPTSDGYIQISIKDQGIGMTKQEIEKLGSPFYSLKKSGTGLGMMITFQIIRSFQGKVRITSEKEIGTEIFILLPKVS
jgi:two-component system sporulation sensor kinase B